MAFLNNYPPSLITGLTLDFTGQPYTRQPFTMESVITAARTIQTQLTTKSTANQYLLVQNLPTDVLSNLIEDKNALDGIPFRFTFNENTGLIKIIPTQHIAVTRGLAKDILLECLLAGVPSQEQIYWTEGGTAATTYKVAAGGDNSKIKGKQPDDSFLPLTQQPNGWPTLVIESVFQSPSLVFARMRNGGLRIPPERVPYLVQSITTSPRGIEGGAAITIRFRELLGRPPKWDDEERDALLGGEGLVNLVRVLD